MFEPRAHRSEAIDPIPEHIPRLVSHLHNVSLHHLITLEEVESAVVDMPSGKAPGPHGFTSYFCHHCWDIFKYDVWAVVADSQRISEVLPVLNATLLTLILKCHFPHLDS